MKKCLICNKKLPMFRHWNLAPSICRKCWKSAKKKICRETKIMDILNSLTTTTPEPMRRKSNPPPNIEPDLTEPDFDFQSFMLIILSSIVLIYIATLK